MTHPRHTILLVRSLFFVAFMATILLAAPAAQAYEVWLTDQSDTGKESGGLLYIYDGAQLAANPFYNEADPDHRLFWRDRQIL